MPVVCAWCNKDASGRVVCFRCGKFPAPVDHVVSPTVTIKICERCETVEPVVTATHAICEDCEKKYWGGV
jgi:hypothetical protein